MGNLYDESHKVNSHNHESFDLKFGVGKYVSQYANQPEWITWKWLKISKLCQQSMNINLGHPFRIRHEKLRTAPPVWDYHHDVISGLQENIIILKTVHDRGNVIIEHK